MAKQIECKECGVKLKPEQIQAHVLSHWGVNSPDKVHCRQAYERYMELWNFACDSGIVFQVRPISL